VRLLAAIVVAFFPLGALSQVHMCKGADGRKVFSDVPCGPDATIVEVKPSGGGSAVYPSASMKNEFYDIRGTTTEALRREIAAKGPEGRWWGTASTSFSFRITTRTTANGCAVDTVRAAADSTVRLPRWANRAEAPAQVQDQWDGYLRSLELHERGHVQISLDAAKDLERTLREIPEQPSCSLVEAEAKRRSSAVNSRLRDRQVGYDAETDHGRKQWTPYR
jgi:predicted secreted Zn-dependent protease